MRNQPGLSLSLILIYSGWGQTLGLLEVASLFFWSFHVVRRRPGLHFSRVCVHIDFKVITEVNSSISQQKSSLSNTLTSRIVLLDLLLFMTRTHSRNRGVKAREELGLCRKGVLLHGSLLPHSTWAFARLPRGFFSSCPDALFSY